MGPRSRFDDLRVSEILVEQMLNGLTDPEVRKAKKTFKNRIKEGRKVIKRVSEGLNPILNMQYTKNIAFKDYLSYLKFLYTERPKRIVDRDFNNLSKKDQDRIKIYQSIFDPSDKTKDGLEGNLRNTPQFIEVVYSDINVKGRKCALKILRIKDSHRGVDKIAEKLVDELWDHYNGITTPTEDLARNVRDWLGIKASAYHPSQVDGIVGKIYKSLPTLNLERNPHREFKKDKNGKRVMKDGEFQLQDPGIDDHRRKKGSQYSSVQMSAIDSETGLQIEFAITSASPMLANEIQHGVYRAGQKNIIGKKWGGQRSFHQKFQEFKKRGYQIVDQEREKGQPKTKTPLILTPEQFYEDIARAA
jgi:hypothetical protein